MSTEKNQPKVLLSLICFTLVVLTFLCCVEFVRFEMMFKTLKTLQTEVNEQKTTNSLLELKMASIMSVQQRGQQDIKLKPLYNESLHRIAKRSLLPTNKNLTAGIDSFEVDELLERLRAAIVNDLSTWQNGKCSLCPPGMPGRPGNPGTKGDTGVNGIDGLPGPKGMMGRLGKKGYKGDGGVKGEMGFPGHHGPVGPWGAKGDMGEKGFAGRPGSKGMDGNRGPPGLSGVKGEMGYRGVHGPVGPRGAQGNMGEKGFAGRPGSRGMDGLPGHQGYPGSQGIRGFPGIKGQKGQMGIPGIGFPGARGSKGHMGVNVLNFPRKRIDDKVVLVNPFYNLTAFTVALWVQADPRTSEHTPFCYFLINRTENEIAIFLKRGHTGYAIGGYYSTVAVSIVDGKWHHISLTWQNIQGTYKIYIDGVMKKHGTKHIGRVITKGAIVLGQDQDKYLGEYQVHQSLQGNLTSVNMWDKVLTAQEISDLAKSCTAGKGNVVKWSDLKDKGEGAVKLIRTSECGPLK